MTIAWLGGAQCADVSGVGRQPGPALEVVARIGKPCAPLLRIRPARAAHGLGRQVTTLDHKLAAKLAAPMTREIFIGSVPRVHSRKTAKHDGGFGHPVQRVLF